MPRDSAPSPPLREKSSFRRRLEHLDRFVLVGLAAVVGLLGGLGAVAVRFLIGAVQSLSFGTDVGLVAGAAGDVAAWRYVLVPALGGLLVGPLIWYGAREARGHGVPEVMLAVLLRGGRIRPRVAFVKALASAITIGSGGSAGREGPMVQIGSSLGSVVAQLARLGQLEVKTLVGAGAAAGIAAAFNAPIAGTIFALEVILGDFTVAAFSPVVVASVTATVVARAFEGDVLAFPVPEYDLVSVWEFLPYSALGIAAGLVAVLFVVVLYWQEKAWEGLRVPEPLKPCLGGLLVGAIALGWPHVLGTGYETITGALDNRFGWQLLLLLIPLKIAATSLTLGSGGSGGVFAPSLLLGAALGGGIGQAVQQWAPHASGHPGAYALVGMGAVVAAATHAPLAAILILFEMTGDYTIILPLMISCILATLVASLVKRTSIYTQKLEWKGIQLHQGREEGVLRTFKVAPLVETELTLFRPATSAGEVLRRAMRDLQEAYPIVDADGRLTGVVRFRDLRTLVREASHLAEIVVADDVALPPFSVTPDDDLQTALDRLTDHKVRGVPVVADGRFVGMVFEDEILSVYRRELRKIDLAEQVVSRRRFRAESPAVSLDHGVLLDEIEVPPSLEGRTLREADLRRRLGVEVLFVRLSPDGPALLPDPGRPLERGSRLVVMGEPNALAELSTLEPGAEPDAASPAS